MAKKDKYTELCGEISKKVKANGSKSSHSKSDLVSMAQTFLNTPEHEVDIYASNSDPTKGPTVVQTKPVERYRNSLKPILRQFGVDREECEKIQDVVFPKEHAEAMMDAAQHVIKDYTATGRKLILPITTATESQMSIAQTNVATKVSEPKKLVHAADGSYHLEPINKITTVKEHSAMKAANKVPHWLKTQKAK